MMIFASRSAQFSGATALRLLGVLGIFAGLTANCGGDDPLAGDLDGSVSERDSSTSAPGDGSIIPDDDADIGDASSRADGALPPTKPPFDWVGIIGTGQSLSVGAQAGAPVSTTQPFKNGKLVDNGPNPKYPLTGGTPQYSIVPLVEIIRPRPPGSGPGYADGQYPGNLAGETPHSGMANEISTLFSARSGGDYVTLHSVVGWSGHPLVDINKGGGKIAYGASLMEAKVFANLAKAAGKSFGYGAIILTHGEADAANQTYGAGLKTLIDDYNTDLKAITGQTRDVVLLVSQQSVHDTQTSSGIQVWQAGVAYPGKIVCTGPKYQYGYGADHLHMPAAGYRRLGEKYGEVYDLVVNQGKAWKPLQPKSAVRQGNKIVVTFDVPNPPLQWDLAMPPNHQTANTAWAKGHGFEVHDAAKAPLTITAADITAANIVTLTLSTTPAGTVTVGYATVEDGTGNNGGLVTGYRGQLRDSDELVGYDEQALTATLTNGSATVTLTGTSTLNSRALRDVITGAGAPANLVIQAISSPTEMTLSAPWPGATGAATIKVHHDLHNYAVHSFVVAP